MKKARNRSLGMKTYAPTSFLWAWMTVFNFAYTNHQHQPSPRSGSSVCHGYAGVVSPRHHWQWFLRTYQSSERCSLYLPYDCSCWSYTFWAAMVHLLQSSRVYPGPVLQAPGHHSCWERSWPRAWTLRHSAHLNWGSIICHWCCLPWGLRYSRLPSLSFRAFRQSSPAPTGVVGYSHT